MYPLKFHPHLTVARWKKFGLSRNLLMVATEFSRCKNALLRGDEREVRESLERAFELFDLTVEIVEKGNLLRELLRFREVMGEFYLKERKEKEEVEKLLKTLVSLNKEAFNALYPPEQGKTQEPHP